MNPLFTKSIFETSEKDESKTAIAIAFIVGIFFAILFLLLIGKVIDNAEIKERNRIYQEAVRLGYGDYNEKNIFIWRENPLSYYKIPELEKKEASNEKNN